MDKHKALSARWWIGLCFLAGINLFIFSSCSTKTKEEIKIVKVNAPQDLNKEIEQLLTNYLNKEDSTLTIDSTFLSCYKFFKPLYTNHLLWFNNSNINAKGDSLLSLIEKSIYYGLIPSQYHFSKIKNNIDSIHSKKELINVTSLVRADILLSDAYFLIGAHLNKGRFYADSLLLQTNFNKLDKGWDSVLVSGYKTGDIKAAFDSLEPKFYHYQMLKKELAGILNDTMLFQLDSIPFISQKDSTIKRQLIIKNLIKQGFYDTTSIIKDSLKLARAINKLQKKWFIQPDGKIGKYTIQALSYNRQKIIQQICMTMERWRWENKFPEKYAFINIPAFWLTVYEKDTVVMQSAIVCGKPENQTPILKSKIDHMLIYPYWNVPIRIATKEILPAVQRDTTYIRRKNFEVLGAGNKVLDYTKIPWKKYTKDYLPVRFRQRIGEENSLGVVKFNFHNPFGVYLHDTNSKRYFKTSSRAQSHGCIRLENFIDFADFLIRDDSVHYTHDSLQVYFAKQEQRKIKIKKPLPIYTRYYTAYADSLGLKLYIDVYRKDEEMMKLIYKNR
ncbi:MAG: L,D-transpeptidase family protein [Bacteroidia bacterium]|nr:L,D-transpeptidase family protein [Bacteroidia bacterium]